MLPSATSSPSWATFDVIKGVLALALIERRQETLPASARILHQALFDVSQNPKYKRYIDYSFDAGGTFPFSREFQTDLTNLEMCGHLANPNPVFRKYKLGQKLRKNFERTRDDLFDENDLQVLKCMSGDFLSRVQEIGRGSGGQNA